MGNKVYEQVNNGGRVLKRILIDGGYYDAVKKKYFYYLTDLGNNRMVAEANGTVVQKTYYYPFGMAFAESMGEKEQPYKYNGKKLDRRLQLNAYDYPARYMDPSIRWFTSIDPLAENYYAHSPYAYVMNNPMRYTAPTGMSVSDTTMLDQIVVYENKALSATNTFAYYSLPMKSFADDADAAWARGDYWGYAINFTLEVGDGTLFLASFGTSGYIKGGAKI